MGASGGKNQKEQPSPFRALKRLDLPNSLTLIASLCLLVLSASLWLQFTRVRSRETIVEVRTLTLKSPIEGHITSLDVKAGEGMQEGQSLFQVTNSRVPQPRVPSSWRSA